MATVFKAFWIPFKKQSFFLESFKKAPFGTKRSLWYILKKVTLFRIFHTKRSLWYILKKSLILLRMFILKEDLGTFPKTFITSSRDFKFKKQKKKPISAYNVSYFLKMWIEEKCVPRLFTIFGYISYSFHFVLSRGCKFGKKK